MFETLIVELRTLRLSFACLLGIFAATGCVKVHSELIGIIYEPPDQSSRDCPYQISLDNSWNLISDTSSTSGGLSGSKDAKFENGSKVTMEISTIRDFSGDANPHMVAWKRHPGTKYPLMKEITIGKQGWTKLLDRDPHKAGGLTGSLYYRDGEQVCFLSFEIPTEKDLDVVLKAAKGFSFTNPSKRKGKIL